MHDAAAVKARLTAQLEAVLAHLFPAGKIHGHEFEVGSVSGEAGGSLKVELRGDRRGVWKDFATGHAGDVFDLWGAARGIDFKQVMTEACAWLGLTHVERPAVKPKPPAPDMANVVAMRGSPAYDYLRGRKIAEDTMRVYRVRGYARTSTDRDNPDVVLNGPGQWLCWSFTTPDGEPVMLKTVGINPRPNGKKDIWSTKPWFTLWGWWLVKPHHRRIAITEGEIDAMSLHQIASAGGWDVPVLSLPSGCENMEWIENDFDALNRFEEILLFTDADPPGENGAKAIAQRLGPARCRRVPIGPAAGYKDANDILCRHAEPEELELSRWLERSYTFDPPALRGVSELRGEVFARLRRVRQLAEVNTFLFPAMPFQFRDGELTLFTGYPHGGKSTGTYQTHLHEMRGGAKVLGCSFEIGPDAMVVELVHMLVGHAPSDDEADKAMAWLDGKLWFIRPGEKYRLDDLTADIRYAVARFGVTRWFVDSLHYLASKDDYEGQDHVSRTLFRLANATNTHGVLVCHSPKADPKKIPGMMDVEGSGGICKPPDNIITWWRNEEKKEKLYKATEAGDDAEIKKVEALPDGLIVVTKQRLTGKLPRRRLWFDAESKTYRDTPEPPQPTGVPDTPQQESLF